MTYAVSAIGARWWTTLTNCKSLAEAQRSAEREFGHNPDYGKTVVAEISPRGTRKVISARENSPGAEWVNFDKGEQK